MASGIFDDALLKHIWSTDELRAIFNDRNRVQKWYDYEAALALEQAELGIIPRDAAQEIASQGAAPTTSTWRRSAPRSARSRIRWCRRCARCRRAASPSTASTSISAPRRRTCSTPATVLQMKDAHAIYLRDLKAIGKELYRLAETHRATPMVGRTHGVQALPITFGHKCAIWLSEMGRHHERMRQCEPRVFVGGMVGRGRHSGFVRAAGARARAAPDEAARTGCRRHQLAAGARPLRRVRLRARHARRRRSARSGTRSCSSQHTEIDELYEPFSEGKLGSSTMPHKRNPSTVEGLVGRVARAALQRRAHHGGHGDRARARRRVVARRMEGAARDLPHDRARCSRACGGCWPGSS